MLEKRVLFKVFKRTDCELLELTVWLSVGPYINLVVDQN